MTQKTTQKTQNNAQQPPKGVGISPRLFVSLVIIIASILFLVMVMVFHYRSHQKQPKKQLQETLVAQQSGISAEAAIQALDQKGKDGVLLVQRKKAIPTNQMGGAVKPESYRTQQVIQAAKSPISVVNNYHGPSSQSNTNVSGTQTSGLLDQAHQLNAAAQNAFQRLGQAGGANYQAQNMQDKKVAFLKANKSSQKKFYLDSRLTKPISPYEVKAGSLISATLLTGIDSDLPGQITASVSRNIYDTVTGNYLLIPQGTKVIGTYDSQVSYGQERVLIAWNRLIFPDGDSFDLEGQPGADLAGMAGLHDQVNNHYLRIFGSSLAFSIFGALGQLSQPKQAANSYPSNSQIIYGAIGQSLTQTGIEMTEKNMNIQPTITIRPGANFNILLTRDMVFPGPYHAVPQPVFATNYQSDSIQNRYK